MLKTLALRGRHFLLILDRYQGEGNLKSVHKQTDEEGFILKLGMDSSQGIYKWIQDSFELGRGIRSGTVHVCDSDFRQLSAYKFSNAFISAVTMPTLDGASKDPAYMTVSFLAENIQKFEGDGEIISAEKAPKSRQWYSSNYRLSLGSLPTNSVKKIDSFTWTSKTTLTSRESSTDPARYSNGVEVPNIKLTLAMKEIYAWQDWHRDFLVSGESGQDAELIGGIEILSPDLRNSLAEIKLENVGIISLELGPPEANTEVPAHFMVELYVRKMIFNPVLPQT